MTLTGREVLSRTAETLEDCAERASRYAGPRTELLAVECVVSPDVCRALANVLRMLQLDNSLARDKVVGALRSAYAKVPHVAKTEALA